MNINDIDKPAKCRVCNKVFQDKLDVEHHRLISKWKQLAVHIMTSKNHPNKKWAIKILHIPKRTPEEIIRSHNNKMKKYGGM